jgi:cation transport regulator ChaC
MPGRPGRVVTLIPVDHASLVETEWSAAERCWGMAYEISAADPDDVLAGLDHRERGGYERIELEIEVYDEDVDPAGVFSVMGLVYIAGPGNDNYLGAAPIEAIANQIATAFGPSGANPEYVFELANRLRAMRAKDMHVYSVEAELRRAMGRPAKDSRASQASES